MVAQAVEASKSKPIPINCDEYDVDRFMAKVDAARFVWSTFDVPQEWTLPGSAHRPTRAEFQPVLDDLAGLREAGADYPVRQAYLTYYVLHEEIWPDPLRQAIAYATLRLGMADHHYQPRRGTLEATLLVCDPEEAFWRYGHSKDDLLTLLEAAYEPVTKRLTRAS